MPGTAGGSRATRAAGGRRAGGRLSFSSAFGMDGGSGGEGGGAAAGEERSRVADAEQKVRRVEKCLFYCFTRGRFGASVHRCYCRRGIRGGKRMGRQALFAVLSLSAK